MVSGMYGTSHDALCTLTCMLCKTLSLAVRKLPQKTQALPMPRKTNNFLRYKGYIGVTHAYTQDGTGTRHLEGGGSLEDHS